MSSSLSLVLASVFALSAPGPDAADGRDAADSAAVAPGKSERACKADERRKQRAAKAAGIRRVREARSVAAATMGEARLITEAHFDRQQAAWQKQAAKRGRAAVGGKDTGTSDDEGALSAKFCRALAARDQKACATLRRVHEARPCATWLTMHQHSRGGQEACKKAPKRFKAACQAAIGGDEASCDQGPKAGRALCTKVAKARASVRRDCFETPAADRCTWDLLTRVLGEGVEACAAVAAETGGERSRLDPMHTLCTAVATGNPGACQAAHTRAPAPGATDHVRVHTEATLLPRLGGAEGLVSVAANVPVLCLLRVDVTGAGEPIRLEGTQWVASWRPGVKRFALPASVDERSHQIGVKATCVVAPF